jgi:hypothetical protein
MVPKPVADAESEHIIDGLDHSDLRYEVDKIRPDQPPNQPMLQDAPRAGRPTIAARKLACFQSQLLVNSALLFDLTHCRWRQDGKISLIHSKVPI